MSLTAVISTQEKTIKVERVIKEGVYPFVYIEKII